MGIMEGKSLNTPSTAATIASTLTPRRSKFAAMRPPAPRSRSRPGGAPTGRYRPTPLISSSRSPGGVRLARTARLARHVQRASARDTASLAPSIRCGNGPLYTLRLDRLEQRTPSQHCRPRPCTFGAFRAAPGAPSLQARLGVASRGRTPTAPERAARKTLWYREFECAATGSMFGTIGAAALSRIPVGRHAGRHGDVRLHLVSQARIMARTSSAGSRRVPAAVAPPTGSAYDGRRRGVGGGRSSEIWGRMFVLDQDVGEEGHAYDLPPSRTNEGWVPAAAALES